MHDSFLKKTIVALIWMPVFIFLCYQGGLWLLLPIMAVAIVGMGEYYSATFKKGHRPAALLGYLAGTLILLVTQYAPAYLREGMLLAVIIFLVGFTLLAQFGNRPDQSAVNNSAVTAFGVIYVALMLSFMIRMRQLDLPAAVHFAGAIEFWHRCGALLIAMVPVWCCDVLAQMVGRSLGRHKLAPTVSPNKTIEGSLAGFVAAMIGAVVVSFWVGLPWYHALLLGALAGIVGQLGDLGKSVLKRDLQIKDFGTLFGPHGGVLDRFDAVMFSIPLSYLYLWLFFTPH
jgi:phosphatidate cytidylyltransferase